MAEEQGSSLSQATNYEKMAEFWDAHSTADYDEETYEVEMTFDPSARQNWVRIEPDLLAELHHIAQKRRISAQTLVNLWLKQGVTEAKVNTAA